MSILPQSVHSLCQIVKQRFYAQSWISPVACSRSELVLGKAPLVRPRCRTNSGWDSPCWPTSSSTLIRRCYSAAAPQHEPCNSGTVLVGPMQLPLANPRKNRRQEHWSDHRKSKSPTVIPESSNCVSTPWPRSHVARR